MGRKRSRSVSSSGTSSDSQPSEQYHGRRSHRSRSRSRERRRDTRRDSRSPRHGDHTHRSSAHRHVRSRSPRHSRRYSPSDRRHADHRNLRERSPRYESQRGGRQQQTLSDAPPEEFSIHRAKVQSVRPFGVFVAFPGHRRHGMVHNSQIAEELRFSREDEDDMKVKAMEFYASIGSEVWVKVVEVRQESNGFKVACSMKAVSQEDGTDLDPSNTQAGGPKGGGGGPPGGFRGPVSDSPPELGSIQKAAVRSIKPYGVFVQMEGFRSNALVHVFQVADGMDIGKEDSDEEKVAAVSAVVSVGEQVYVKVVEIKEDDGSGRGPKISASIKLVSQKDGTDLDPHGTKFQPRGAEGGGPPGSGGRRPVGGRAGEAAGGKVDWGHLSAGDAALNAAFTRGGQQYDMIGEEVDDMALDRLASQGGAAPLAPLGRGRGAVQPAWMTNPAATAAPGSDAGQQITSLEEALAILAAAKHSKRSKKDKKQKKEKKDKKEKHAKHKHKHKS